MDTQERFAVIDPAGRVAAIVRLREGEDWTPDEGCEVVRAPRAEVGWVYRDGRLRPPSPFE